MANKLGYTQTIYPPSIFLDITKTKVPSRRVANKRPPKRRVVTPEELVKEYLMEEMNINIMDETTHFCCGLQEVGEFPYDEALGECADSLFADVISEDLFETIFGPSYNTPPDPSEIRKYIKAFTQIKANKLVYEELKEKIKDSTDAGYTSWFATLLADDQSMSLKAIKETAKERGIKLKVNNFKGNGGSKLVHILHVSKTW